MKRRMRRFLSILTASTLLSCTVMGNITTAETADLLRETSAETGTGVSATASDADRIVLPASDSNAAQQTSAAGNVANAEYQVDADGMILDGEIFNDLASDSYVPTVSYVDEFGEVLGGSYEDVELPVFEDELALDDPENAPVEDVVVRSGFFNMHQTRFGYLHALADGEMITGIRRTVSSELVRVEIPVYEASDSDATRSNASRATADDAEREVEVESAVYAYTADGIHWTEITEDTELLFVFAQEGLTSYVYEDDAVTVTAHLQYKDAIPAGVELKVTPITEDSAGYNYDAYMQALNDNAAMLAAGIDEIRSPADQIKIAEAEKDAKNYSKDNTLLYDIAFIKTESDGTEIEYEPAEGSVRVTAEFHQKQLSGTLRAASAEKVDVIHLPLTEEVKETIDATKDAVDISAADIKAEKVENAAAKLAGSGDLTGKESVEFTTDSFSAFAFTYTVDFTYGGYTWSFPGQGSYALTGVLSALGIAGEVKDASLALVKGTVHYI